MASKKKAVFTAAEIREIAAIAIKSVGLDVPVVLDVPAEPVTKHKVLGSKAKPVAYPATTLLKKGDVFWYRRKNGVRKYTMQSDGLPIPANTVRTKS